MKRRILLVDDEVAVLLTLKAVLEISGFDVDTAASAREGKAKLRTHTYHMVITDMRMEHDASGEEVIAAARAAAYSPAIALLTAFPVTDENWQDGGADKLLVKPMQTRVLLQQIEQLFLSHEAKLANGALVATPTGTPSKVAVNKAAPRKLAAAAAVRGDHRNGAVLVKETKPKGEKEKARRPPAKAVMRKSPAKK
ncbi:MAG TPA: response regulator [Granulicella sp.]|jgi:DNA-binding response OmpR family regulator|nr:response regulator [Granulicella sp.]